MSRALTVLGVALLWSTAGCIHPHSWHRSHPRTHGSIHLGWRHKSPPPVVHSHGHGCGHVQVGAEWVVHAPDTSYGFHAPSPTSERHDRGLHRGHHKDEGKTKGHDEGKTKGHDEGKGKGHDEGKGKGHDEGKGKGRDQGKTKGHDEGKTKGHDEAKTKGHDQAKTKGHDETHA